MTLLNKAFLFIITVFVVACSLPQFSMKPGGRSNSSDIPGKTVQVNFFENKSSLAGSIVSSSFTESLRNIMLSQTSLELVSSDGDLLFDGYISDYKINPLAIQAGSETAAQNRLTMSVRVSHSYPKLDSIVFNETNFSSYVDFDSNLDFNSIEEELVTVLNNQLSQDIYDKAFGGDW